jgi:hypothetical protein
MSDRIEIMPGLLCRQKRGLCVIGIALLAATAQVSSAGAAAISWAKKGEFETCLESSLDKWLAARAELEVKEDPTAAQLDDAAVATWTLETIAQCRARGGTAEAASEDRFTRHMAQWRQHIYDLAADIRKRGQSD